MSEKPSVNAPRIIHEYRHPASPKSSVNLGTRNPVTIMPIPIPDAINPTPNPLLLADNHTAGSIIAGTKAPADATPVTLRNSNA